MKSHEFFHKYTNTPIPDREKVIKQNRYGGTIDDITLSDIYKIIMDIENKIWLDIIERDRLLEIADGYFNPSKR